MLSAGNRRLLRRGRRCLDHGRREQGRAGGKAEQATPVESRGPDTVAGFLPHADGSLQPAAPARPAAEPFDAFSYFRSAPARAPRGAPGSTSWRADPRCEPATARRTGAWRRGRRWRVSSLPPALPSPPGPGLVRPPGPPRSCPTPGPCPEATPAGVAPPRRVPRGDTRRPQESLRETVHGRRSNETAARESSSPVPSGRCRPTRFRRSPRGPLRVGALSLPLEPQSEGRRGGGGGGPRRCIAGRYSGRETPTGSHRPGPRRPGSKRVSRKEGELDQLAGTFT